MDKDRKKVLKKQGKKIIQLRSDEIRNRLNQKIPVDINHPDWAKYYKESAEASRLLRSNLPILNEDEFSKDFEIIEVRLFEKGFPGVPQFFLRCLKCQYFVPTWRQDRILSCRCGNVLCDGARYINITKEEKMVQLILADAKISPKLHKRGYLYLRALMGMEHLLTEAGETGWCNWIREDIKLWNQNKNVKHHLSAYGGMGSFNDIYLQFEDHKMAWGNILFDWLKSLCYTLANSRNYDYSIRQLRESVGIHDASLSAFVGGTRASEEFRGMPGSKIEIQGASCQNCSYTQFSKMDIDFYIAKKILPELTIEALVENSLIHFIDKVLTQDLVGLEEHQYEVERLLKNMGYTITSYKNNWIEKCPKCNGTNFRVHREYLGSGQKKLNSKQSFWNKIICFIKNNSKKEQRK